MHSNSRSQPTTRVGNLNGRRREVGPDTMGSSQPTPRVGNLNGRRREVVPDTMGSSQPTPRVGNLSKRRRGAVPDTMGSSQPTPRVGNQNRRGRDVVPEGSDSGTQQNESVSFHSTPPNDQLPSRNSSPPPIAGRPGGRPPKRSRRSTIQTTAYTEPEIEPDGQGDMEPVHLSDDSSDEYHASDHGEETEPDTEPDVEDLDSADGTLSRQLRGSQTAERQGNHELRTVRISTTSGSQDTAFVRRTPAARVSIIPGRAYTPPTFPSSSTARYSSPLGIPSVTTSGVRSSSPPTGELSTPQPGRIRRVTNSRRNTVTGVEGEIVGVAKYLMLQYTLFVDPLPDPVTLTSAVHSAWSRAQDEIADDGNIEASEKSLDLVSAFGRDKVRGVLLTIQDTAKTLGRAGAIRISYKG